MASPIQAASVSIDPVPNGVVPDNAPYTFTGTLTGGNYDTTQFAWGILSGSGRGTINDLTGVYTPPTVSADETVTIILTVIFYGNGTNAPKDSFATQSAQNLTVTVRHFGPAIAPMVTINAPAQVNEDQTVQLTTTLTGGAYDDVSETWSVVSGGGAMSVGGLYKPPNVVIRTTVEVQVEVTVLGDGTTTANGSTATATATASFLVLAVAQQDDSILTIGGTDASSQLLADSLVVTQELRGVGYAAFQLKMQAAPGQTLVIPVEGHLIAIQQDGNRTFLGELRDVLINTEEEDYTTWACKAVDYRSVLLDRLVTIETDNVRRIPDIVQLLQTAVLNSEGIIPAPGLPSGTNVIPATRWVRRSAADILNEIMEVEDWAWSVNTNKQLVYGPYGETPAPRTLTQADVHSGRRTTIEKNKDDYANRIIFEGGRGTRDVTVDGVMYPMGEDIVVTVSDDAEIARRAAVEAGSGIHEKYFSDRTVFSPVIALARARGILARRNRIATIVTVTTDQAGFQVGQSVTINFTDPEVNGKFLIERMGIRTLNKSTGAARYTIRARSSGVLENLGTYIANLKKK